MGRSPVFATSSVTASRPAFSSMSPGWVMTSPGIMASPDRFVDGDELGAVGEGCFDLHVVDHLGDALHHLIARYDMGARFHEFGNRAPVPGAFDDEVGDERDGFGVVELDTALQAPARHH